MTDPKAPTEAARLSKLLYEAREQIEMWSDVVENRTGQRSRYTRELVRQIDAYRAERGWPANGWGGESEPPPAIHPLARPTDGNSF